MAVYGETWPLAKKYGSRESSPLELAELDLERLQTARQEAVFALYLGEEKIEPEVVENMRTWCPAAARAPPAKDLRVHDPDSGWDGNSASPEPRELTFVDEATFWSTF